MTWQILEGDCIERMAAMPAASVDAFVTDPPYFLSFMGKAWDTVSTGEMQRRHELWAREALRVLKPGGHLLAFGGTRTYHRLTCAIEDAGFEVRDCIAWMYGSGFPKSLDVGKAIDKAAGAEREVTGPDPNWRARAHTDSVYDGGLSRPESLTAPATPDAVRWDGWGTALKPAHEPIVVARKPLAGTVAGNVLEWGTGALNVDGCRIEFASEGDKANAKPGGAATAKSGALAGGTQHSGARTTFDAVQGAGRWPANVVLDPEAAAVLDEQTGESVSRIGSPRGAAAGDGWGMTATGAEYDDAGGASRFFYVAKADSAERNAGLSVTTLFTPADAPTRNDHPTVKPIALMRWLVRLVTPPGGLVLDPFAGSGTTGCAAVLEGFDFMGVEREEASVGIARARIAHWSNGTTEDAA